MQSGFHADLYDGSSIRFYFEREYRSRFQDDLWRFDRVIAKEGEDVVGVLSLACIDREPDQDSRLWSYYQKSLIDNISTSSEYNRNVSEGSQGRGIGLLLYAVGHHIVLNEGMTLGHDHMQTEPARRMWQHFHDAGWTRFRMTSVDVDLYEFDPEKMPDPKTILVLLNSRKNNLSLRAY